MTIRDMAGVTRINHMLPERKSRSAGTALGLIVGSILKEFPVESLAHEEIVDGRSVLDLYRAVTNEHGSLRIAYARVSCADPVGIVEGVAAANERHRLVPCGKNLHAKPLRPDHQRLKGSASRG